MRSLNISLFLLSAMVLGISCSDNIENGDGSETGTASLTVSIKGQPATRSTGVPGIKPDVESLVSNFTVLVFNYTSGDLEKSADFKTAESQLTGTITDLSTGTKKRIVTLVNVPTGLDLSGIKAYSDLSGNLISLESQNSNDLATVGLFMSGETEEAIILSSDADNNVTVPVKRRVAKIVLKSLIFKTDPTGLPNYQLNNVSVQKARVKGNAIGEIVQPDGNLVENYAGGIASPDKANPNFSLTYNFLSEALAIPQGYAANQDIIAADNLERYFYVLPNDGSDNNPTLLTLSGTYGTTSSAAYYPFVINGTTQEGSTDGTFIQSNKIYEVSVIINHPNTPSEDPNVVPSQGVLNVTITPLDWDNTIKQEVEW